MSRLKPIDEIQVDKAHLNSTLMQFDKNTKLLEEWYKKFNNYYIIDGKDEPDKVTEKVEHILLDIIETKNKKREEIERQKEEEAKRLEQERLERIKQEEEARLQELAKQEEELKKSPKKQTPRKQKEEKIEDIDISELDIPDDTEQKKQLMIESAKLFDSEWFTMEELYRKGLKSVFRKLRQQHMALIKHLYNLKQEFIKFLLIPDERQKTVSTFQREFNEIDNDVRANKEIKEEQHARVEEFKETLIQMCDDRKKAAEEKVEQFKQEPWENSFRKIVFRQLQQAIQVEVNRYIATRKFLEHYFNDKFGRLQETSDAFYFDVIESKDSRQSKRPGGKPKKGDKSKEQGDNEFDINNTISKAKSVLEIDWKQQRKLVKSREKKGKPEPLPPLETIDECKEAFDCEDKLFLQRLDRIEVYANKIKEEIDMNVSQTYKLMKEWYDERYKAEIESVNALVQYIQEHIETEKPLMYELRLEGEKFIIDDKVLVIEPPVTPKSVTVDQ